MIMSDFTTSLLHLIHSYGSIGVFGLVILGIIGLPLPIETLLLLTGILVKSNQLFLLPAWLAATLGTLVGISISYLIGRTAGHFTVYKLCSKLGISKEHIEYVQSVFNRIGAWILLIAYFIPIVRHLSGLVAGTTQLPYKTFALFAYSGAFIWSNLFFWIGFLYGMQAFHFLLFLYQQYGIWIIYGMILLIVVVLGIKFSRLYARNV
ncbi:MAG: DedA family protein [Legionellales bacterium]|nr:DedA family protein [Legionellales bacterium]